MIGIFQVSFNFLNSVNILHCVNRINNSYRESYFLGANSLGRMEMLLQKISFPGPLKSVTAKENYIGFVVSEILIKTQTMDILLFLYKD